jgi:hypothetical protein
MVQQGHGIFARYAQNGARIRGQQARRAFQQGGGEQARTRGLNDATECRGASACPIPEVHAVTDVTGFGLPGYGLETCQGSGLTAQIDFAALPLLKGVAELGFQPGAAAGDGLLAHRHGETQETMDSTFIIQQFGGHARFRQALGIGLALVE